MHLIWLIFNILQLINNFQKINQNSLNRDEGRRLRAVEEVKCQFSRNKKKRLKEEEQEDLAKLGLCRRRRQKRFAN